ncbi:hypothetical protein IEQ34_005178 [Dendrobium chrysotoxum]|uniref:Uncharacterized protein n=1 Tax=Dendrobium chrysotoxum TaxID=161865 RepID=A0AAV7GT75_DENCH|nr:hypothetical protein IEQ34_005178 [Dendrobium chrysotoxum]
MMIQHSALKTKNKKKETVLMKVAQDIYLYLVPGYWIGNAGEEHGAELLLCVPAARHLDRCLQDHEVLDDRDACVV